jgi:hypothetical protein
MIINSPLCITHYAGQTPLNLTGQSANLTPDQLIDFNKLLQSVSTIYASQNPPNGAVPTFWTKPLAVENGVKIYQPDSNSTLVSLQPRQSYYFIMRESAQLPINIPAAGGPLEGFIDDIQNLPSIKIITSTVPVSNLTAMSYPSASITSPENNPVVVPPVVEGSEGNTNNETMGTQAIIPNSFNATNNTYSFNIAVTGLQSYKNYTYSVDVIDAEWPTYFVGKPSGTLTTGKNTLDTIEDISSVTNRLVFCASGACDSYPEILNPYTTPDYPILWRSSIDYRVIIRASLKCDDCLNDNTVYSDYIILKYATSNLNTTPSLPNISFKITE